MNRSFSIYLDLVRFLAAVLVYLYHSNQRLLVEPILPFSNYGHSSVIVFFVLSGYVIAYVTETKERDWVSYAASRVSRVYSVALPAIVLTLVLDGIGRSLYPALYAYPFDQFAIRTLAGLLMANEVWFVSITGFSNVPYWSICYEVWYYVGFALVQFAPGRLRWGLVGGLLLLLGPKVGLLAPIWVAGVVLYRWQRLKTLSAGMAWPLAALTFVGIWLFHQREVELAVSGHLKDLIGAHWRDQLTFSKFFLSDYLLALMVFLNFAAMRVVAPSLSGLWQRMERPVRFLAGYTFTLYLLHQPLFLFWAALLRGDPSSHGYWLMTSMLMVVSVLVIGHFTESRRHLLRAQLVKLFQRAQFRRQSRAST